MIVHNPACLAFLHLISALQGTPVIAFVLTLLAGSFASCAQQQPASNASIGIKGMNQTWHSACFYSRYSNDLVSTQSFWRATKSSCICLKTIRHWSTCASSSRSGLRIGSPKNLREAKFENIWQTGRSPTKSGLLAHRWQHCWNQRRR